MPALGRRRRKDPAPSLWRYRLERLFMRRWVRFGLRIVVPAALCLGLLASLAADPAVRAKLAETIQATRDAVVTRPELQITRIEISGLQELPEALVREVVPLHLPAPALTLDLDRLRHRLEGLDAVVSATVRAEADGTLSIAIVERMPVAIWRHAGRLTLIDRDGIGVAKLASRRDRPDLPLLVGEGAGDAVPEAARILAATGPLTPRVRGLVRLGARRWDLVLDRGQRILLPEEAPVAALRHVIALHHAEEILDRDILHVDMRMPATPVLRLSDHARRELLRIRRQDVAGQET
ncbi:MAG: cell division protein FtsQ/DivIB [Pseudomonadota bacterium]